MRRPARILLASSLLSMSGVVAMPPASALSCVGAEPAIADAEVVFSGRIVDSLDGRLLVEVDEVWKGAVEEEVWLREDLPGWSAWADQDGEIPDGLTTSRPWVFAPYDAGLVNSCTSWPAHSRELRGLRPSETSEPVAEDSLDDRHEAVEPRGAEVPWVLLGGVGGGLVLVALAGVAVVLRRRTPSD